MGLVERLPVTLDYRTNKAETAMESAQITLSDELVLTDGLKAIMSFSGLPTDTPLSMIANTFFTFKVFPTENSFPVLWDTSTETYIKDPSAPNVYEELDPLEGGYFGDSTRVSSGALYQSGLQPWQQSGNIREVETGFLDQVSAMLAYDQECATMSLYQGNLTIAEAETATPLFNRTDCHADNPAVPTDGTKVSIMSNIWNLGSPAWANDVSATMKTQVLFFQSNQ